VILPHNPPSRMNKTAPPAYDSTGYYSNPQYAAPQQAPYYAPQGYAPQGQPAAVPQYAYAQPAVAAQQVAPAPAPDSYAQASSNHQPDLENPKSNCRNPICAFVFVAQMIAVLAIGIYFIRQDHQVSFSVSAKTGKLIAAMVVGVGVAAAAGLAFLEYARRAEGKVVFMGFVSTMIYFIAGSVICFAYGSAVGGALFLVVILLNWLWYYCVRSRVRLTEAIIHSSTQGLREYWGVYVVAFTMVIVTAAWMVFWAFAVIYTLGDTQAQENEDGKNRNGAIGAGMCGFVLSLYWCAQVFMNISHTTTAGSIGMWWYNPGARDGVTKNAFYRASVWSLGSIAFGSFIVAALETLRFIIRSMARRSRGSEAILACILLCILGCIERWVEYFNVYAYTLVGLYGYDYLEAARQTSELFKSRGFDLIINDNLSGLVIFCGTLISGAAAALVGGVAFYMGDKDNFGHTTGSAVAFFFLLFFVGICTGSILMAQLSSAICTTFVIWAQDPAEMERNRSGWYGKLRDARNNYESEESKRENE